jgi:hypothetical protein
LLVIRHEQLQVLQEIPRHNIEAQFAQLLFRHYPKECRSAGDDRIRKFVQNGIQGAAGHGYLTLDTIGLYINLMMILGSDFDSDPQFGWAQSQLDDFSLAPPERIRALFRTTVKYLDQVVGTDSGHIVRAMVRIRKHDFEAPFAGAALENELAALLIQFYPEKAKFQGDDVNLTLIHGATQRAAVHGIHGPNGISAYVTLAFMLGIGFDTDPMYWWAADSLAEMKALGERAALARLVVRSRDHIEASLRASGGPSERQE